MESVRDGRICGPDVSERIGTVIEATVCRVKMAFDVSQATASGGLALGLTLKTFDLFRSCNKFKSCFVKWRCLVSLFTFFRNPNQLKLADLESSHKTNAGFDEDIELFHKFS